MNWFRTLRLAALWPQSKKVGGLRFVRVGRLSLSFCLRRRAVPALRPDDYDHHVVSPTAWRLARVQEQQGCGR